MIAMKNFMMQEIFNITQRIKKVEWGEALKNYKITLIFFVTLKKFLETLPCLSQN